MASNLLGTKKEVDAFLDFCFNGPITISYIILQKPLQTVQNLSQTHSISVQKKIERQQSEFDRKETNIYGKTAQFYVEKDLFLSFRQKNK